MTSTSVDFYDCVLQIFSVLTTREQDILKRRFRLHEQEHQKHTLEDIGRIYNITRERVRQIESDSIKKLREVVQNHPVRSHLETIHSHMELILRKHGGVMEEGLLIEKLFQALKDDSATISEDQSSCHRDALRFLISNILMDHFEKVVRDAFHPVWKLKEIDWNVISDVVSHMVAVIAKENHPLTEPDLLEHIKRETSQYEMLEHKLRNALQHLFEHVESVEQVLLSYLHLSNQIKSNLFEEWGLIDWNTISPKKINDKIYLMLKKAAKPLHFNDITAMINEIKFDHKQACAATVHNELILDPKYVLVGRGMYALREWGYEPGTVADVIAHILRERGKLSKPEILVEVQKKRIVKQATVNLALMNKERFSKMSTGEYGLIDSSISIA